MEKVAEGKGCIGNSAFQSQVIAGGEWTGERGGQYRFVNQNLQESSTLCLASLNCNFIWIASYDEASPSWGSRGLPECQQFDEAEHHVYQKICGAS